MTTELHHIRSGDTLRHAQADLPSGLYRILISAGKYLWRVSVQTYLYDADGALWCVSSTGMERIPAWSQRRAGRMGGVRFKRIVLSDKWTLDTVSNPERAAKWAVLNQGRLYDWQLILGKLAWLIPHKRSRVMCSEACAEMLGLDDAWRFDRAFCVRQRNHN